MILVLVIIGVFAAILILGLCRVSAAADQHMMLTFDKWLREHPEETQQLPAEEII